jgi:gamma-glutamyltranspeptidase/glutathione hydrolase
MPTFDWDLPYPSRRSPVLAANVVATSQPLAAQAGLKALMDGGNAVDAAVAAAMALTVVEPVMNGIGADAFALVWDGRELHGLNASGHSPAGWTRDRFARYTQMPVVGWDSVTVPGAVSAWVALNQRFGRLPLEKLVEPAAHYAEHGFLVSPVIAGQWESQVAAFRDQPGFAEAFVPNGRAPRPGALFRFPAQSRTLRAIASTAGEAFYRGELAEKLVAASRAQGGALTMDDLAQHRADWVVPLGQAYGDVELHEIPPNGQGIAAQIALGLLRHHDLRACGVDTAASVHLQIEAMKLAFADLYRHVADPRYMRMRAAQLLHEDYLRERAQLIDPARAQAFGAGVPPKSGTVYLATADASGMMVSFIQSNYAGFGSGIVVPGTGIALQNRGACFTLEDGHPNCVGPCKRPFHTIIPAFLTCGGHALASLGVMGADMQAQGHVQMIVRLRDYAQGPQAAVDAPRWKVLPGGKVIVEHHMPDAVLAGLAERGHDVRRTARGNLEYGAAQWIQRIEGGYVAASEPRRDGQAVGY